MAQEDEVRRIWKDYFEDFLDTQEQVAFHMCVFDGTRKANYFGGEPIRGSEVEVRVGKDKSEEGQEWKGRR